MVIKTQILKNMLSQANKGVGNNKLLPITSLFGISANKEKFIISSTDGTTQLHVKNDIDFEGNFSATLFADKFSKLISKMTCEDIDLTIVDNVLKVKGNGNYSIELPVDENGNNVVFPNEVSNFSENGNNCKIDISEIKFIKSVLGDALATDFSLPIYTNYYFGNTAIATDSFKIAAFESNVFNKDVLINPQVINLLCTSNSNFGECWFNDTELVIVCDDIEIHTKLSEDTSEYAYDKINELINVEFPYECKVSRAEMISAVERVSIFVGKYDINSILIKFTRDGITISSNDNSASEYIEYEYGDVDVDFEYLINSELLLSQLKSYPDDVIMLQFGHTIAIKLVSEKLTQLVALMLKHN